MGKEPKNLSSISRTHSVEGGNQFLQVVLLNSTHMLCSACPHTYLHIHRQESINVINISTLKMFIKTVPRAVDEVCSFIKSYLKQGRQSDILAMKKRPSTLLLLLRMGRRGSNWLGRSEEGTPTLNNSLPICLLEQARLILQIFLFFVFFFTLLCFCDLVQCVCVCTYTGHGVPTEVRKQLLVLFPACGFLGWDSGQPWWQVPLPGEPSHQLQSFL